MPKDKNQILQQISQFKQTDLYEKNAELQNLKKKYLAVCSEIEKKRLKLMDELLSLKKQIEINLSEVSDKLEEFDKEIEEKNRKAKERICNQVGHTKVLKNVQDLGFDITQHSFSHGMFCRAKFSYLCIFCGEMFVETSTIPYRSLNQIRSEIGKKPKLKSEQRSFIQEQKDSNNYITEEYKELIEEQRVLFENLNAVQKELEKLCKTFGHIIPPYEQQLRSDTEECSCCGKKISYKGD